MPLLFSRVEIRGSLGNDDTDDDDDFDGTGKRLRLCWIFPSDDIRNDDDGEDEDD